jgi:crossover junction endodeoxyribonuclease RuvC
MIRPLRAVALDLSLTATGIAVTHDQVGEPRLSCRTVTPRKRPSDTVIDHVRLHETICAVQAAVKFGPDLVVIEKPLQIAKKGDISIRLAELHGPIKHWLWSRRIPYVDVHLTHVKQYATGSGGADKPAVLAAVIARYGRLLHVGTHDEADAVSLLAMALDAYGQALVEAPAVNRKALAGTVWPELDLSAVAP